MAADSDQIRRPVVRISRKLLAQTRGRNSQTRHRLGANARNDRSVLLSCPDRASRFVQPDADLAVFICSDGCRDHQKGSLPAISGADDAGYVDCGYRVLFGRDEQLRRLDEWAEMVDLVDDAMVANAASRGRLAWPTKMAPMARVRLSGDFRLFGQFSERQSLAASVALSTNGSARMDSLLGEEQGASQSRILRNPAAGCIVE